MLNLAQGQQVWLYNKNVDMRKQIDGYAAYSQGVAQLNAQEYTIEHANCWAHCRRTFEKSLKMEPLEAQTALDFIAVLYKNEAHIRENDLDEQQALNYRHKHSEPVINAFFAWVYQQRQRTDFLPSNPLAKALAYAHERQVELKVFLINPHVAIYWRIIAPAKPDLFL